MGTITKIILITGIFVLGAIIGWYVRDSDGHKDTELTPIIKPAPVESPISARLVQLQKLFALGNYEAAIAGMHDLSEADHQSMRAYLYRRAADLIEQGKCEQQLRLFSLYFQQFERSAAGLMLQSRCQILQQDFDAAISNLYEARTFDISLTDEKLIGQLLLETVLNQEQLLRSEGKLAELDYFYQSLLVQEPEQGAYYMQLALVRQELGDVDGAIGALLQIENDQTLGSEARQRLDELQQEKDQIRNSAHVIPLQVSGSRLIVQAVLDGQYPLRLLLDTGAGLTIVEPDVLRNAGYRLDLASRGNFKTANGETQAPIVRIANLAIRSHLEPDLLVGSMPLDLGAYADGLLGMNYLQHYRFSVDQVEGLLYLSRRH